MGGKEWKLEGMKLVVTQRAMTIGLYLREMKNQVRREDSTGRVGEWIDSQFVAEVEDLLVGL